MILIFLLNLTSYSYSKEIKKIDAYKRIKKDNHVNILLITLDTTRADKIGVYGCKDVKTPNIDSLARSGIYFINAYTPVPITLPAHCSIMTGTYPIYHQVRNNGNYVLDQKTETLAEILKRNRYVTSAFVSSFTVDSRFGLDQGFDVYNDNLLVNIKEYKSERKAEKVFEDFSQWFHKNSTEKFFCWLHFFDPHDPYDPPEPFKSEYESNKYLGEIAYVDYYVGKTVDLLKEKQVLEKTLIIIVGDHGEAFGEHEEFGHQIFCYEENLKVPFIFYAPGRIPENLTSDSKVNLIDVMPTILDFTQLQIPDSVQGISLIPMIGRNKMIHREFYIESIYAREALGCAPTEGIIQGDFKFLRLPKPELYNIKTDHKEKNNLFSKNPKLSRKLIKCLDELIKRYSSGKFDSQSKLSQEEKRRLASLGYLVGTKSSINTQSLIDPKEGIEGYNYFLKGTRFIKENNFEEAEILLKQSITILPSFPPIYSRLADVYLIQGRKDDAINLFEKAIQDNPSAHILKLEYAQLLGKLNRINKSVDILKELSELNLPDIGSSIYYILGQIYLTKEKYSQSIDYLNKALDLDPDNSYIKKQLALALYKFGRFKEALEIYLKLEKEEPMNLVFLKNMAILYTRVNEYDNAISYFEKIISIYPDVPDIYYNYACLLAEKYKFEKAVFNMEKFLKLYDKDDARKKKAQDYIRRWKIKNIAPCENYVYQF